MPRGLISLASREHRRRGGTVDAPSRPDRVKRVVITGAGTVILWGLNVPDTLEAIAERVLGIGPACVS